MQLNHRKHSHMNNNLADLARELEEARRDAERLRRLQAAEARAEELAARYADAKAAEEAETARRAAAEHEAQFVGITEVRVADTSKPAAGDGPLGRRFTITYVRETYDMKADKSVPKQHEVHGFAALPKEVLLYLIEKQPQNIPAAIMALSPDNPREAIERYFIARRRGHC